MSEAPAQVQTSSEFSPLGFESAVRRLRALRRTHHHARGAVRLMLNNHQTLTDIRSVVREMARELRGLLSLVLHCCVNETLATVCLREGLKCAESPTVKAATRQLLQDDLNHARSGWAHLGSPFVGAEAKAHVARALPTLLRLGRDGWLDEPRAPIDAPAHGVLGNARFPELLQGAVRDLILPGFEHVGVDTRPARAFFAASRA